MKRLVRYALTGAAFAVLAACGGGSSPPAEDVQSLAPTTRAAAATRLRVEDNPSRTVLDPRLLRLKGPQRVWVTMSEPSLAAFKSSQLEAAGLEMQSRSLGVKPNARILSAGERTQQTALMAHRNNLRARQNDMVSQLRGMGAQELGRVHVAHNAVAIKIDASSLTSIAQLSGVAKVRPVIDYALDLSETVPYVGGAAVPAPPRFLWV
jgi:minor extracellular serine protease Vpr